VQGDKAGLRFTGEIFLRTLGTTKIESAMEQRAQGSSWSAVGAVHSPTRAPAQTNFDAELGEWSKGRFWASFSQVQNARGHPLGRRQEVCS
jgi:hypothetical protein